MDMEAIWGLVLFRIQQSFSDCEFKNQTVLVPRDGEPSCNSCQHSGSFESPWICAKSAGHFMNSLFHSKSRRLRCSSALV